MDAFQIIVFEDQTVYDSEIVDSPCGPFINKCKQYISPDSIPEENTSLQTGVFYLKYSENTGNSKSMMVLLIGNITADIILQIKSDLKKMYIKKCRDCGKEIRYSWKICGDCANK